LWAAFSTAACAQDGGGAPGPVTLDFADADIAAVARTMATLTGRNVVVDPRVKGLISLSSVAPVTPAQAMQMFAAQLRTQGFALVEKDGIALVLPEAEAKLQSASVSAGPVRARGGQIVTQIFRLTHESAVDLVPVLRPLISPNNTINVNASTNALVITDYADNLQRIARIVAALDVSEATGIEVVPLKHALASDLAPLVARLTESGGSGGAAGNVNVPAAGGGAAGAVHASAALGNSGGYKTAIIAEPRSNAIILRAANPARLALAKSLIGQLDQPPATRADGSSGNLHVVYLKNADAVKLAVTLRAALAALPGISSTGAQGSTGGSAATSGYAANTAAGAPPSGGASAGLNTGPSINAAANNQPSTGGPIQADPATNSLIISAPDPVYRELRAVIDKLDQRRAQVFVESLIAEVRADKVADFGVQWQAFGRNSNGAGAIGTNYATSRGPNGGNSTNIVDFAAQFFNYGADNWTPSVVPNTGMNLILGTQALGVLANFIQSTGMGNVLSTPTLLTLDNEEAKIIVGQNVPFVTGSYANTGASSTSVNPFQTYERQDVGLTLRVRPQISEDGTIKLVLYQEVSSVVSSTASSSSGPTTSKRAIESSVLVNDGAIVVLGGLLEDQFTSTEDKVPGLGDVPLIGNLFKSRNRSYVKTNLMVFLRPVIVRDAASAENFSLDRYDLMRATQQGSQPDASAVLQINRAPVLPAATPVQQQPSGWVRPAAPGPLIEMPATGEANYEGG
jgi:general secretion pathway protein D